MTKLKEKRMELKITQNELAVKSGVQIGTLQKFETGENDISRARVDIVYKLSQALNTTIEELINQ